MMNDKKFEIMQTEDGKTTMFYIEGVEKDTILSMCRLFSEDAARNIKTIQDLKPVKEDAPAEKKPKSVDIDILELESFDKAMKAAKGKGEPGDLMLYYVMNWVERNKDVKDTDRQKAMIFAGKNFIFRKAMTGYVQEVTKKTLEAYSVEYINACSEILPKTDAEMTDKLYQTTMKMWLRYLELLKKRLAKNK